MKVTVIIESKNAKSGRWCEFDYMTVEPTESGWLRREMGMRYGARYWKYRRNPNRNTRDYYFDNGVEVYRVYLA